MTDTLWIRYYQVIVIKIQRGMKMTGLCILHTEPGLSWKHFETFELWEAHLSSMLSEMTQNLPNVYLP